jgi:aryl-alcohol dehydrogenase-like predicted oxidoreductase
VISGFATSEDTAAYRARFPRFVEFFREAQGMTVSSLGIGSYLGRIDDATDHAYEESMRVAVRNGINFIDTSLNYRDQSSERNIGAAVAQLVHGGRVTRGEFVVASKAGYLVPGATPEGAASDPEVVDGSHSLSPRFLTDQLERSRNNLGLETIDIFYLHNPETQLSRIGEAEFYRRVSRAFEVLEEAVSDSKIRYYGAATWTGFRQANGLSLRRLEEIARSIAGDAHKFRFIQLPLSLAMPEALHLRDADDQSVLDVAVDLDISVVASATILQSRLASGLPAQIRERLPGLSTDAQRAIQFARSTPGIDVALVGMSQPAHVVENLGVAEVAPVGVEEYLALFRQ